MENGKLPAFGYGFANEQAHQEVAGLSKREYFSAMAMQGLLSCNTIKKSNGSKEQNIEFSKVCVEYADSLLRQLEDGNNSN